VKRVLRHRYGRSRLTPDVLPYDGVGMQSPGEYKATLAFLRAVRDGKFGVIMHALHDAPISSNEYRGALAAARGGLTESGRGLELRLTTYGRLYLEQRGG
jgi:hypothetical protein